MEVQHHDSPASSTTTTTTTTAALGSSHMVSLVRNDIRFKVYAAVDIEPTTTTVDGGAVEVELRVGGAAKNLRKVPPKTAAAMDRNKSRRKRRYDNAFFREIARGRCTTCPLRLRVRAPVNGTDFTASEWADACAFIFASLSSAHGESRFCLKGDERLDKRRSPAATATVTTTATA